MSRKQEGFTLIEIMVVVAIVAILAAVALPNYTDYVTRGKLVEATSGLSDARVRMEQYFQDNRAYPGACVTAPTAPPLGSIQLMAMKYFTLTCVTNPGANTYTVTADGTNGVAGFKYTIDQDNGKTSTFTGTGASKGYSAPSPNTCWSLRKGGTC
jgi:type IV pilus assembly protein PilE